MIKKLFSGEVTDKKVIAYIFLYLFFLLLFTTHMSPMYFSNEWSDVNVYFTIGKSIFNGKVPYTEVFDHKGPFIFFLYGFGYLISNHSFFGMFLIEFACWFLMVYSLYRLANLYLGKAAACLASFILPVLLIGPMKAGGSAEEFILTFQCISLYFFVKYFKDKEASRHNPYVMLLHGALWSAVLFSKINLCIFWFFPLAGIFLNLLLKKEFKNFGWNALAFVGGVSIIAAPICIYFYVNNALAEAYDVYILLNSRYGAIKSLLPMFYKLLYLYLEPLSLCILAPVGVFCFSFKCIGNTIGKWAFFLTGLSLFFVVYAPLVYQYYYPVTLLSLSFLGIVCLFLFIRKYVRTARLSPVFVMVLAIVLIYTGFSRTKMMETRTAGLLVKGPGIVMGDLAKTINKEKDPTLLALTYGMENGLFTACNIVPNVRYFISPNLTHESYPQMRDEQTKYIEEKKVKFIVMNSPTVYKRDLISNVVSSSGTRPEERETNKYAYFRSLPALQENYTLIQKDTILSTIDENSLSIIELYKIKE